MEVIKMVLGCRNGSAVSYLIAMAVAGAGAAAITYGVMSSKGVEKELAKKTVVEMVKTGDESDIAYNVFKGAADANFPALMGTMARNYEKDREGMAMTVQACTGVVGMEKDYAKRLYAAFPVMSGSADPNNLSLDQKMVEGKRTAMMHDEGARLDYVVTQTDVMGKKVLGLYQVPGTAMQPTAQAVK